LIRSKNGGSCLKNLGENYYSCKCLPNYSGLSCENYDMCATKPCLNEGSCINRPPSGFECKCAGKYYGDACQHTNLCYNYTNCQNGGICDVNMATNQPYCKCNDLFMGQYCTQCKNGYVGSNCNQRLNACTPNPCINGMCLLDSSISYKCVCSEGKFN
jgi:hypothetical protein